MIIDNVLHEHISHEPANQPGYKNVICNKSDLVENSGVCALLNDEQIAIFYLPTTDKKLFAVSNWDPIGKANVLSRGILGDIQGKIVVSSPLYKQHFDLESGICIEDPNIKLKTYSIFLEGTDVNIG